MRCSYCNSLIHTVPLPPMPGSPFNKTKDALLCPYCDFRTQALLTAGVHGASRTTRLASHRSLRCTYCKVRWPVEPEYDLCPLCREPTVGSEQQAIPKTVAALEAAHANFGWWLWESGRL